MTTSLRFCIFCVLVSLIDKIMQPFSFPRWSVGATYGSCHMEWAKCVFGRSFAVYSSTRLPRIVLTSIFTLSIVKTIHMQTVRLLILS